MLAGLAPLLDADSLLALQAQVQRIHLSDPLLDYVQDLIAYTRQSGAFVTGLSPRAGLALIRAASAWAMVDGRTHALPDDIQAVLPAVIEHRLRTVQDQRTR